MRNLMTKQNVLKIVLISLIAGPVLIGCGANKMQHGGDFSSAANFSSTTPTTTTGNKPLANCSHDVLNDANHSIRLMASNTSAVYVHYDRFPAQFDATDAIQFWSYTVDANGTARPAQRLNFKLVGSGLQALNAYTYQDLTWQDLQSIASYHSLATSSAQAAMGAISFEVQVPTDAKVLMSVLYETENAGPTRIVEALIPRFYANPNDYAVGRPTRLTQLHPLQDMTTGNWDASQYESEAQRFCF